MIHGFPMSASFQDLYCQAHRCPPEEFHKQVLKKCLFPKAAASARLLWQVNRSYFKPDLELIDQIKNATDLDDVRTELDDFYHRHPPVGLLRDHLKVRVSGQRLLSVAGRLFAATAGRQGQARAGATGSPPPA